MSLSEQLKSATRPGPDRKIPGAVLIAADAKGNVNYVVEGVNSVNPKTASPLTVNSTFWMASCTKLLTTVAALQCVEQGKLKLDEDIGTVLPEWKSPNILTGFKDSGEPQFSKATKRITLRHLLSHSSGMAYDFASPNLKKWLDWKKANSTGEVDPYLVPLLFEPGEGWCYGCGLHWAGQMVERVNGSIRLGDYMNNQIWKPLRLKSTGFRITENENIRSQLVEITTRIPNGELITSKPLLPEVPKVDSGAGGLYSSASDYIKVLVALLKDDETLLKRETVKLMFTPQLSDTMPLVSALSNPHIGPMFRGGVEAQDWNYGLGGVLNTEDVEGICKKGTMTWNGVPNIFWWIDPAAGSCGLYLSQLLPPGDPTSLKIYLDFRRRIFIEGFTDQMLV